MKNTNTTKKTTWASDPFAEDKMKQFGLDWDVMDIPISQIKIKENIARHKPVNEDLILDYSMSMTNGDVFPRVVLNKTLSGYYPFGGHHRIPAAELAGFDTVEAYVVNARDEDTITYLPMALNRGHGARQERKEAIKNAVAAMIGSGRSAEWASNIFGIKKEVLQIEVRISEIRKGLEAKGIKHIGLADTNIIKLGVIKNENVRGAAARVAETSGLIGNPLDVFLEEIKSQTRSEASQMSIIAKYEVMPELSRPDSGLAPKAPTGLRNHANRLSATVASLESVLRGKRSLKQIGFTDDKKIEAMKKRMVELSAKLYAISNTKS